jgi:hypothetical protein
MYQLFLLITINVRENRRDNQELRETSTLCTQDTKQRQAKENTKYQLTFLIFILSCK